MHSQALSDDHLKDWLFIIGLAGAAVYSFWYTFNSWRKNRVIEDTPTSRVRSAAQGYVELSGRGILPPGAKNTGPLSGIPCVWWRYRVEQRRRRNGRGQLPVSDTSQVPFLLDDGTGQCLIDPRGANVFPGVTDVWYGPEEWPRGPPPPNPGGLLGWLSRAFASGDYRYIEHRLPLNEHVYAIGAFHSVGGVGAVDTEAAMTEVLREWKKDQPALLARFDTNHDGTLSHAEWERARAAARQQVIEAQAAEMPRPTVHVLTEPGDGRAFLLAASDGESLAQRFRARAFAGVGGFVAASAALTWMLTHV